VRELQPPEEVSVEAAPVEQAPVIP
jgi:hypothetical protein